MPDAVSVAKGGLLLSANVALRLESRGVKPPCGVNMFEFGESPRKLKPEDPCMLGVPPWGGEREKNTDGDSSDEELGSPDALEDVGSSDDWC